MRVDSNINDDNEEYDEKRIENVWIRQIDDKRIGTIKYRIGMKNREYRIYNRDIR